ncbi:MAG TPA: retron system putative HNH endonuclease [Pyrinomonadaceae bacterium]
MIRVNRKKVPLPPDLADDGKSTAARERLKTDAFYADKKNHQLPYDKYAAYKKDSVIKALNDLFRGKCAYCESIYAATQPTDVEHYRPKGGVVVAGEFTRPGYYWLAASWENLLPSCIDCNRERKQDFTDKTSGKSGKANHFPLTKEDYRAKSAAEIKREARARLLLDPCHDDPDKHLVFEDDGVVKPLKQKSGRASTRGENSIRIYGLNRYDLASLRAERARETLALIARIKRLEQRVELDPDDKFGFQAELLEEMALLKGYGQPDRRYAGMVRQLVRRHYRKVDFDS